MDDQVIISKINEFLFSATNELCDWLNKMLPRVTDEWWQECVLSNLSYNQSLIAEEKHYTELKQFDLAALLRITIESWYDMRAFAYLPVSQLNCVKGMRNVRNNWAHCAGILPEKEAILNDLDTILYFFESVIETDKYTDSISAFRQELEDNYLSTTESKEEPAIVIESDNESSTNEIIKEKDKVFLTGKPNITGMVYSVSEVNGTKKYEVFVEGDIKTFYEGQIQLKKPELEIKWSDSATLQSHLTACEINNPSAGNLYSLNAARIDFVPYQFRPALKLIKSDEPRILIADSVGVGKTIEAGLIIKELEARNELDSVVIICPKPLVAERKWYIEMKRFDEEFESLDSAKLRQILSDTHRDGVWPSGYNKVIIPYSILDSNVYGNDKPEKGHKYSLMNLDPAPHFDLVIIDEAHHIRNGSLDKEKAFAYKCVHYFCQHADAVVMLTATPLQTKNDDLFTLLNLLRPDVILDKDVFNTMLEPNEYIYRCSHIIRGAAANWQKDAISELKDITTTSWGQNVIAKNPLYESVLKRLGKDEITREERVKLITDVESLHSFNTMINRTRRRDIQDFCIRRPYTEEISFTPEQSNLHNSLLKFEYAALAKLHGNCSIPFMMSMIRRQAASCIFGLAPFIEDIIHRRFYQIADDAEIDIDSPDFNDAVVGAELNELAQDILTLADNLPEDDPKFDSILKIINEKQKLDNNKIIIFSTFRHTLSYLYNKLKKCGYRVAKIDGSVKDEDRRDLRQRFELKKEQKEALDILLFTEVGSEGLDYQFCDTMINYDLPWNPMRIEQRIGRIDRRGQKSETVSIYNIITKDTVDADIYDRCLKRIGIFENSIGECEEILGEIGSEIEKIVTSVGLTKEERCRKLEIMAENEVRKMQELIKFEDEQHSLFGFDLSEHATAKEIKDAESPWLSTISLQLLVEKYLTERIGDKQYIYGKDDLKQLRLGKEARLALLEDYRNLPNNHSQSSLKKKWESFLKGDNPLHKMTFIPEEAEKERNACFMTPMHPLVRQAANHFKKENVTYINLEYYSDKLPEGSYLFTIYIWNYAGITPQFRLIPICSNKEIASELTTILQDASDSKTDVKIKADAWDSLEKVHVALWQKEKQAYITSTNTFMRYRSESLANNYKNCEQSLNNKIRCSTDERIVRMYQSQLKAAEENYKAKVKQIENLQKQSDIWTSRIANGIITIKRG